MLKQLVYDDVKIYEKQIDEDTRKAGYNIGDLLNMPFLDNTWNRTPHHDMDLLKRMNLIGKNYKGSILNYYCDHRKESDPVPNINLIVESVTYYNEINKHKYEDVLNIVKDKDTLCVHVRSGDLMTELGFINKIEEMSYKFKRIVLLSGVHGDEHFAGHHNKKTRFVMTINDILNKNKNDSYIYLNEPDVHLMIMMNASNLLLHKGGFSCLGSVISTGRLFITNMFYHHCKDNWKKHVNKPYIMI
uniref:Uncharacterized protein n=1 Tax=viral metagenome TaxID=1070528 RepID=A0A6C0JQ20_9ZZZZ